MGHISSVCPAIMTNEDFKQVRSKAPTNYTTEKLYNELMDRMVSKLSRYESTIIDSQLFTETVSILKDYPITHIRCLALGSPSDCNESLYQLAYMTQICLRFEIRPTNVSLYDPVFNKLDYQFLTTNMKFKITDTDGFVGLNTLYFLPHASLEVTEQLFNESRPLWLLGNDIVSHTDRLTKKKIYDTYRTISLLTNILESSGMTPKETGEFISVSTKRKKNRNKKSIFKEPQIEYNYDKCYFKDAKLTRIKEIQGIWGNSFTDIAFHSIIQNTTLL